MRWNVGPNPSCPTCSVAARNPAAPFGECARVVLPHGVIGGWQLSGGPAVVGGPRGLFSVLLYLPGYLEKTQQRYERDAAHQVAESSPPDGLGPGQVPIRGHPGVQAQKMNSELTTA